jgi:hypothetical protein
LQPRFCGRARRARLQRATGAVGDRGGRSNQVRAVPYVDRLVLDKGLALILQRRLSLFFIEA